jgi:[ribosomal protein S5]-alanine N-acetyltransferase
MDDLPHLKSDRTILRLAHRDDVAAIVEYYTENYHHLAPFEPSRPPNFYTETFWCDEVRYRLNSFRCDMSLKLFLFKREEPKNIIGTINFSNFIRGTAQSCSLGYGMAAGEQGKGYMTEALKIAIDYVFCDLNMHRITAAYIPHNQRSGNVLKKLGFVVEGYARDYLLIDGEWQDHILTSLVNNNWQLR